MNDRRKILSDVIKEVLEKFAFMFIETADDGVSFQAGESYLATITYAGKYSGKITLVATESCCKEMAANVLGTDADEVEESAAEETLKELLNIICGSMTWSLYGDKETFHLGEPVAARASARDLQPLLADPNSVGLLVEDQPILANLMENEPPAA